MNKWGTGTQAGEASPLSVVDLRKVVTQKDSLQDSTVIVIRREKVAAEISAAAAELADLLGIRQNAAEYTISFGEVARNDTELAMLTRSTLAIMLELSGQVRAPAVHVEEGRTVPSLADRNHAADAEKRRLVDIRSSIDKPEDAFVAVKYRDYWFWIDDRDFKSKRSFAYLMLLFSLTESGGKEGLPLVTIPAG